VESIELEEICTNCGSTMYGRPWDIEEITRFNPHLKYQRNNYREFISIGNLLSQEPMLLSYAINDQYLQKALGKDNIAILFAKEEDANGIDTPISFVFSKHPQTDFFLFHNYLVENTDFYGRSSRTSIAPTARVHPSAFVAETNVVIQGDAVVGPNASVLENTVVGTGSVISSGVVLGVYGARLIYKPDGTRFLARHGGGVSVGKKVFIGANSVIVRSVWRRPTTIGDGAFIGNLVNIGHNCQISENATVLPGAVLCGRAEIGSGAMVAPGAMINNAVRVGDGAWVTLGSVVTRDVEPGNKVSGNFAVPHDRLIKHIKELTRKS
jgi:UDP-3-O-[3-hydroxymyristoyl] glucosamine N-acyltransferase